jgi:hypothetical protein
MHRDILMIKKTLITTVLILIFFSLNAISNAEEIEFKIFPSIIEIESKPGEEIEYEIVVSGTGGGEYTLNVYPLVVTDNKGHFTSTRDEVKEIEWISFSPKKVVFQANEQRKINLTVSIPETAELGDSYLSISLERTGQEKGGIDQVSGALEIPLLISVTKDGYPKLEAKIKEFVGKKIYFFNPMRFNLEIENTGFRKLKSYGKIEITDLISKQTFSKELIPQNILSNSSRIVIDSEGFVQGYDYVSWVSPDIFGIYSARVSIYDRNLYEEDAMIILTTPKLHFVYINLFFLLSLLLTVLLIIIFAIKNRNAQIDSI